MTPPERLKDDRAALAALGLEGLDAEAFGAEASTLSEHDLGALKGRLEASIASGQASVLPEVSQGGSVAAAVGGLATATALLVAAGWWAAQPDASSQRPSPPEVPAATVAALSMPAPVEAEPPPAEGLGNESPSSEAGPAQAAPAAVPVEAGAPAPATAESEPLPGAAPPVQELAEPLAEAGSRGRKRKVRAPVASSPTPAPVAPPDEEEAAESDLAQRMAAYEPGRDALEAGNYSGAIRTLKEFRSLYPDGALHAEASIGLLDAYVRSGRLGAAERLAGRLAGRSDVGSRKGEILRVRAEMLARLGRCDEAAMVAADAVGAGGMPSAEADKALAACRAGSGAANPGTPGSPGSPGTTIPPAGGEGP